MFLLSTGKKPRARMPVTLLAITGWNNKLAPANRGRAVKSLADYHEPVNSNAPVLIFSGNMDPVTPPERGEEVASHLPNSRHIVIARGAHGMDGLTNVECIDKVMLEFLAKGNVRDLDTACVERVSCASVCHKQTDRSRK